MLHLLALVYFAALLSAAGIVIMGTLLANGQTIRRALFMYESRPVAFLPISVERLVSRARVIRMAMSAPVLRLAA
jgi:hypothetical protein